MMAESNVRPELSAEATPGDTAGHPGVDPAAYFSSDSLELLGAEHINGLLTTRDWLLDIDQRVKEQTPQKDTEYSFAVSHIGRHYNQHPWLNGLSEQLHLHLVQRSKVLSEPRTEENWIAFNKTTRALYRLYTAYKDRFTPLAPGVLEEEITYFLEKHKREQQIAEQIGALYELYDNTEDETQRQQLITQIKEQLSQAKAPDPDILKGICTHIDIENVMGKFERLETQTASTADLEERINKEGFLPHASDNAQDQSFKYRSSTQLGPQRALAEQLSDESSVRVKSMDLYYKRYTLILEPSRTAEAQTMAEVAARAFEAAEGAITEQLTKNEVALPYNEFPFTLIKRDSQGNLDPDEFGTLLVFTRELMLRPIRKELNAFLEDTPTHTTIDYEAELTRMQEEAGRTPYTSELAQARQEIQPMIRRSLDALHSTAQPVSDVLHGKKPRVKGKNATPEQIKTADLYNSLHGVGFSNEEKGLATAIITGQWWQLQATHETVITTVRNVAEFSDMFELGDITDHPINALAAASFEPTLRSLSATTRSNLHQIIKVLSADQLSQLRQVVDPFAS